jgi:hypothetical protein
MIDMSGLNPYVQSLMDRWNKVMDIQTERLSRAPTRDEIAFREWREGKDIKQEGDRLAIDTAYQQAVEQQRELERGRKAESDAARIADDQRRMALQASVNRVHTLNATYGGATPFNPSGALADYYEYGAGNPQGRGGGGDAAGRAPVSDTPPDTGPSTWAVQNCVSNPLGPGCEGTLSAAGYVKNPTSGVWERSR